MTRPLTEKQTNFLDAYLNDPERKGNGILSYKKAYNCKNMSDKAIYVEVSRLLKNPVISLRIKEFKDKVEKKIEEEFVYTALDHYNELDELKKEAMKLDKPDLKTALQASIKKGELKGLYKIKTEITGDVSKMPFEIKIVE